jgi:hypothetical protein
MKRKNLQAADLFWQGGRRPGMLSYSAATPPDFRACARLAGCFLEESWPGMARFGMAGTARLGTAGQGLARHGWQAGHGWVRRGVARHGPVGRHGTVGQGKAWAAGQAWQGLDRPVMVCSAWQGLARQARHGLAWLAGMAGVAGLGVAGNGTARQGLAGMETSGTRSPLNRSQHTTTGAL